MSPFLRSPEGDPAQPHPEDAVRIVVDGEPVDALPGQTVAAALMATGRDSWRTTRTTGRPRGVFCGIGACFDCLVVVNGIPDVRACQRTITPADAITTQPGAILPHPTLASEQPRGGTLTPSDASGGGVVVVVGAGPAGMSAARAAADAGVEVLLVDSGTQVGGQFHRQLPQEFHAARPERLQHNWTTFTRQRDRIATHNRITHLAETSVWAIEPGTAREGDGTLRLWLQTGAADAPGRRVQAVEAEAVVLAAGAYDRVLPFPGWDLPGVYSAGAAQALAKGQRIGIGNRVVIAGTGPFLLPVAESLLSVGAEVVGLLEANRLPTILKGWLTDPLVALSKLREAFAYAALLGRRGIPLHHGRAVIAAHGQDRVEAVTTAKLDRTWRAIPGTEQQLEVDAVCVGFGFTAQLELAVAAGCNLGAGPDGGPAVVVDANQQTSIPGVFAAGELTGIGGADLAAAEGQVAGASAAALLMTSRQAVAGDGRSRPAAAERTESKAAVAARRKVAKGKRFAVALAKAYPVQSDWQSWSDESTVVCRCEEVRRGEIEDALDQRDVNGMRSLKLTTRVGLGLCQGRVCSRTAADLAATRQAVVRADYSRPVAQPVRLRDLADIQEEM
ncbi:FAD/NAD(P)-binding oxidoreductase [Kribbella alba]|uniref:FAD/NAD(P)-binding oxidoreductase n=1 Tax=Kribbella alba TaxID=190197 RepID=A0ABN2F8W3_9ACTN